MRAFTPLEALLRQSTIYVTEIYSTDGQEVVGMRASAEIDDARIRVEAEREGPIRDATDLLVLLGRLALKLNLYAQEHPDALS